MEPVRAAAIPALATSLTSMAIAALIGTVAGICAIFVTHHLCFGRGLASVSDKPLLATCV
jgi:hypothetical protein